MGTKSLIARLAITLRALIGTVEWPQLLPARLPNMQVDPSAANVVTDRL